MGFNYANLWKLLIDNSMRKTDLIDEVGISPNTLSKLSKNENVSMETLDKLCSYFSCDISELMEHEFDTYSINKTLGTFTPNKSEAIHRWFNYMEGYSKTLVEEEMELLPVIDSVLDPFGGSGTTMLVAANRGIDSYFSEVNPAMSFIAKTKINTVRKIIEDEKISLLISERDNIIRLMDSSSLLLSEDVTFGGFEKYYEIENLLKIQHYSHLTNKIADEDIKDIFKVALASVAVSTSKMIRRGDLRFAKGKEIQKTNKEFNGCITEKLDIIISDILSYRTKSLRTTIKLADDARDIEESNLVSAVITSPPYLNGTNYFRNTKLELKLLHYIDNESDLSSMHSKGIVAGINNVNKINTNDIILPEVATYYEELIPVAYDKRIPTMVSNYFYDMNEFFKTMYKIIKPKGYMIIDIGDSQFAGIHVPTHDILENLAINNGFVKYDESVLRSRKSKNGLELTQKVLRFISSKEV